MLFSDNNLRVLATCCMSPSDCNLQLGLQVIHFFPISSCLFFGGINSSVKKIMKKDHPKLTKSHVTSLNCLFNPANSQIHKDIQCAPIENNGNAKQILTFKKLQPICRFFNHIHPNTEKVLSCMSHQLHSRQGQFPYTE